MLTCCICPDYTEPNQAGRNGTNGVHHQSEKNFLVTAAPSVAKGNPSFWYLRKFKKNSRIPESCLSLEYCKERRISTTHHQTIPTMKIPDYHTSKLGSKDFVFQANKWPFSITCNPLLPTITESFIDLALVKDMKIAMKKVECRNISYGGLTTKLVGSISQTVQVVYDGVPSGTMHLKAKVIRNLTNLYGVDCIAGQKLYKSLTMAASNLDSSVTSHVSSVASHRSVEDSNLDADVHDATLDEVDTNRSSRTSGLEHSTACSKSVALWPAPQ